MRIRCLIFPLLLLVLTVGAPPAANCLFGASFVLARKGAPPLIFDAIDSPLSRQTAERLARYVELCSASKPVVRHEAGADAAALAGKIRASGQSVVIVVGPRELSAQFGVLPPPAGDPEAFSLVTAGGPQRFVFCLGETDRGAKRAVQRLILLTEQRAEELYLRESSLAEKPWKSSRAYMLVNWRPDDVRTKFYNRMVDKRVDPFRYSDEQLQNYVRMFDDLGFNGVQLGESSISWSMTGSKEAYQEILRRVARAAHANGQQVSYLMWAAEFNVGWIDPDVVYKPAPGFTAFTDPRVRRSFEKYYDHYSQLAPDVDMVIGHWFDAGRLESIDDVISYQKLLREKMLARNPNLKFGVNTWGRSDFLPALIDAGMTDFVLLESSLPQFVTMDKRIEFRKKAKAAGFRVGLWGWYMTEYETDQVPNMHVNGHVLKEYIDAIRRQAEPILESSYWSEMEAYHIANIYTMSQAASLLWNPDRDPDEILREVVDAIWGPKDAPGIYAALKLIEDARSGPSWETYSYRSPKRRDGTENPAEDARRARESLRRLALLTPDSSYVPKVRVPFGREMLLEILLPHLEQIRLFAEFRLKFKELEKLKAEGAKPEMLRVRLAEIWKPIPEFNTWIGTYGQGEAWRQETVVRQFCKEAGIKPPTPRWKVVRDCHRALEKLEGEQRVRPEAVEIKADSVAAEFSLQPDYAQDIMDQLTSDGWLEKSGENQYRLVHWAEIAFPIRVRLGLVHY